MNRKFLRTLGIAIIVLPDPTFISDAIGLLLVGTFYLLSRGKKPDSYKQLRELVKSYLGHMKGGESRNRQPVHNSLRWDPEYSRTSPTADPNEVWQRRAAAGQVVHHTLDMRRLLERYTTVVSFDPESQCYSWRGEPKAEKVVHHTLNRRALLQSTNVVVNPEGNSQDDEPNSEKLVHHTLDRRTLLDRYKVVGTFDAGSQRYEWRSEPMGEQVVHHKLNRTLISQYSKAESGLCEPDGERVIHHTLNRRIISRYNQAQAKSDSSGAAPREPVYAGSAKAAR